MHVLFLLYIQRSLPKVLKSWFIVLVILALTWYYLVLRGFGASLACAACATVST